MIRLDELKKNESLKWSPGKGAEVWDMFCAAISGDLETIERLVNGDTSLVRCHYANRTPLYFAVRENQIEAARFLLDHGADLHARDEDICSTPLGWAAKFGNILTVELLLTRGAKPNLPGDPPWATPLAWATRRGHDKIVALLKQRGAS